MGASFSDISLYTTIPFGVGTTEYLEVTALQNYVSDPYLQKMNGYKPPGATRISIQPAFHGIWEKPKKLGSIISIAPYYNYEEYAALDKMGKYRFVLDLIQKSTLDACEEFNWDKAVFQKAYADTIAAEFRFKIDYPAKRSSDRKKSGKLSIEKTETITTVYVSITMGNQTIVKKLFEKPNSWWHDCAYTLAKHSKWLDSDSFGISCRKNQIAIWYSVEQDKFFLIENGHEVETFNFKNHFKLQQ